MRYTAALDPQELARRVQAMSDEGLVRAFVLGELERRETDAAAAEIERRNSDL
ncbi:hypothetical protein [Sphingobium sp. CECT 9361]|uniref:hypothetical protein n=1 Tax=Sphingobium sp. CECT 9361 TaxID=2845384 RepID=UPI001E56A4FC|nr:hypothetical protein [Sphingobium sp. CECT 9361]CAH0356360.1 hypothetical protein SPH9361_04025 [Sphingobium sp. CECT 9361]